MAIIRRSARAEEDYRDIWRFIAEDSPGAAYRFLLRIDSKLKLYAENPNMGASRDYLRKGLRSFPVGRYIVFYRPVSEGIEVVRVLHGARNLNRLFGR